MDEFSARQHALDIAIQLHGREDRRLIIQAAREYADFLLGRRDAEIVGAARALAEKVSPNQNQSAQSSLGHTATGVRIS